MLNGFGTVCIFLAAVYDRYPHRADVRAGIAAACPDAAKQRLGGARALRSSRPATRRRTPRPTPSRRAFSATSVRISPSSTCASGWSDWRRSSAASAASSLRTSPSAPAFWSVRTPCSPIGMSWKAPTSPASSATWRAASTICGSRMAPASRARWFRSMPTGASTSAATAPPRRPSTPIEPPPTADELDYALLRLAQPIGLSDADGSPRGWIVLPEVAVLLEAGAPLLIVQQPYGSPMMLALDTEAIIGRNANQTRIRYKTYTYPGASGSPCFTMDWDLAALHHYGDPAWQQPIFNQGVPIELIRSRIVEKGYLGSISG